MFGGCYLGEPNGSDFRKHSQTLLRVPPTATVRTFEHQPPKPVNHHPHDGAVSHLHPNPIKVVSNLLLVFWKEGLGCVDVDSGDGGEQGFKLAGDEAGEEI